MLCKILSTSTSHYQFSGLLQRPSCSGECIWTLVFLHLQDDGVDGLRFLSDEGQNGTIEFPPHISSFVHVLLMVDWCQVRTRRISNLRGLRKFHGACNHVHLLLVSFRRARTRFLLASEAQQVNGSHSVCQHS